MSDGASVRSAGSTRYRKIASSSSVDESLFGFSSHGGNGGQNDGPGNVCVSFRWEAGGSNCGQGARKRIISGRGGENRIGGGAKTTRIHEDELALIRARSDLDAVGAVHGDHGLCCEEKCEDTAEARLRRERMERAKARRNHMLALEATEAERRKKVGQAKADRKIRAMREVAQDAVDEQEDVVKVLHTCSQRAAAFQIRDEQLKDKAEREKRERDYERRMDLAMEVDRLREIERREKEEHDRAIKRIEDRKVIEEQIEARHRQRLLQAEAREVENREMLERNKRYQEEDEEKIRRKKDEAAKAQIEVIRLNEEAAEAKLTKKRLEKEEEEKYIAYQKAQDEKLRLREEEEKEEARRKMELQKKLLENQTRSMDRQAELDELRARRAMEEKERAYRRKELAEAQKRKSDLDVLHEARLRQQEERRVAKEREARTKQEEYENCIRNANDMAQRERYEAELAQKKNAELRVMLQAQIEENARLRSGKEKEKYDEGRRIKDMMERERARLEAIRTKMVEDMRAKGVKEKYFSEMLSLDIEKFLMK